MNYTLDVKKLLNDMRGTKGVSALTDELHKVSTEISKLTESMKPQAEAKLKQAESKYHELLTKLQSAQKDLDKEVTRTVSVVKKSAKEAEKNLGRYKKLALDQKAKFAAAFSKKKVSPKKAKAGVKKMVSKARKSLKNA